MKIVAILGSPRPKSNSTALARIVLDTAAKLGAETSEFVLNKLYFQGLSGLRDLQTETGPLRAERRPDCRIGSG